jgi:hypothetical protein
MNMKAVEKSKPGSLGTPKLEREHVFDKHDPPRRVRGLWRRRASGALYAYMSASSNRLRYFYPLDADTVAKAVTARQALKEIQRKGELLPPAELDIPGDAPASVDEGSSGMTLEEAVDGYQTERDALDLKDEATCDREDSGLAFWVQKFGKMKFAEADDATLTAFATWRTTDPSCRTIHADHPFAAPAVVDYPSWRRWSRPPLCARIWRPVSSAAMASAARFSARSTSSASGKRWRSSWSKYWRTAWMSLRSWPI